jgi:hypothetical protein
VHRMMPQMEDLHCAKASDLDVVECRFFSGKRRTQRPCASERMSGAWARACECTHTHATYELLSALENRLTWPQDTLLREFS